MKKTFSLLTAFLVVLAIVGCQSKETKANKLIKDYMYTHLHDFKSYEPIETTIDTLYNTILTDAECIALATLKIEHEDKADEYDAAADFSKNTMDVWAISARSSSRALNEYKKAYRELCDNVVKQADEKIQALTAWQLILEKAQELDGSKHLGWAVGHKFRSNNRGGNSALGDYIFFMDKDLKNILQVFSEDDDETNMALSELLDIMEDDTTTERLDTVISTWQEVVDKYSQMKENMK